MIVCRILFWPLDAELLEIGKTVNTAEGVNPSDRKSISSSSAVNRRRGMATPKTNALTNPFSDLTGV